MKTGRNAPCPCGSGKKFKHCCASGSHSLNQELKESLSNETFNSFEDVKAAAERLVAQQNQTVRDDFLGLSSDQVYKMLHFPFDTPDVFQFSEQLDIEPSAPILMLMENIISAIDEKGLKATKISGHLPQKVCKEAWNDYCKRQGPDDFLCSLHSVNKELDFIPLHVARITLELAGFLRKTKGRFYLTKKYQKTANKSGLKGLYPLIFKTYCNEFNWSYWDGYNEVPFLQQSFLFTLYLLKQRGNERVLTSVYKDDFLNAFPSVLEEMEEDTYFTPEQSIRRCYQSRVLDRFLVFLGLATFETIKDSKDIGHQYKIKKTPLLEAMIHFNFSPPKTDKTVH
ncbi:Protein translocase subunit SecA [hydrothermal vent metagenome]|uniref:Protein translocase subunit SecA n=1 Tax=hydrothermal vent metagenome TaxID=652676 RepID=A0A3B0WQL5_9ZZZZ